MITLATLSDEQVDGQRRAKGRKIRKIVAICLDNYNLVLAEGVDPDNLVGKQFFGRLEHLGQALPEYGLDPEHARRQMIDFFARFSGEQVGDLSWVELNARFQVSKRRRDASAILLLYDALKERGWKDKGVKEAA
ncbi:MAG: hypothetical protein ACXAC5_02265 [Promethearchaeota archaeon]|jgi:hypothetical protein